MNDVSILKIDVRRDVFSVNSVAPALSIEAEDFIASLQHDIAINLRGKKRKDRRGIIFPSERVRIHYRPGSNFQMVKSQRSKQGREEAWHTQSEQKSVVSLLRNDDELRSHPSDINLLQSSFLRHSIMCFARLRCSRGERERERHSERERGLRFGAHGDLNTFSDELKPLRNSPANRRCELFRRYESMCPTTAILEEQKEI